MFHVRFETDGVGAITAEYTHGHGIDEPLSMRRGGQNYYYHTNGLGSITALTDSSKAVVQSYVYDSFGQIISQSGSIQNPYTYTAREYDPETGLYYYRARYYDPRIGKFISEDPIGLAGGDVNLYVMVGNDPVNRRDPLGLSSLTYDSGTGTLTLYDSSGNVVGQYPAGNNTTSNSNGPWPSGTYDYSYHTPHPESGPTGPYGSHGNFVFDVPGRTGMGVHSGRRGPQSPTRGCIRTTDQGTQDISNLNTSDPLTTITVQ